MKRFRLGNYHMTPGAQKAMEESDEPALKFLQRHAAEDWGDVSENDRKANEDALVVGGRLLSAYRTKNGVKLWVITEADRSATTILLPEEY